MSQSARLASCGSKPPTSRTSRVDATTPEPPAGMQLFFSRWSARSATLGGRSWRRTFRLGSTITDPTHDQRASGLARSDASWRASLSGAHRSSSSVNATQGVSTSSRPALRAFETPPAGSWRIQRTRGSRIERSTSAVSSEEPSSTITTRRSTPRWRRTECNVAGITCARLCVGMTTVTSGVGLLTRSPGDRARFASVLCWLACMEAGTRRRAIGALRQARRLLTRPTDRSGAREQSIGFAGLHLGTPERGRLTAGSGQPRTVAWRGGSLVPARS